MREIIAYKGIKYTSLFCNTVAPLYKKWGGPTTFLYINSACIFAKSQLSCTKMYTQNVGTEIQKSPEHVFLNAN